MPLYSRARAIAMPQKPGIQGMLEQVEAAARTCYRSEGFTKYDENGNSITASEFVARIVKQYRHESVAEHGAVYLAIHVNDDATEEVVNFYEDNPYSRVTSTGGTPFTRWYFITTNYRVLIENKREDDLQYWTEPTENHIRRYTVRLFTDRGVSAESNRHRANSPTERSTRFVNYGHDGAITVCAPEEISDREIITNTQEWGGVENAFRYMCTAISNNKDDMFGLIDTWIFANSAAEWAYLRLLKLGWKPQQARRVLPMDVETELVVSAYPDEWAKYFGWRFHGFTGPPHPDIKYLTGCIIDQFIEQGWHDPVIQAQEKYSKN